jgi:transcription elongation factor Elf1
MVQNSNYGLKIDSLESCPFCGSNSLKHFKNSSLRALQCKNCGTIGGILHDNHFADSEYLDSSRWQIVYSRWNNRI